MNPQKNTLQTRLRRLVEKDPNSATAISLKIGLARSSLGNYLNGNRTPTSQALIKIASYFSVTTDWLLTGQADAASADRPMAGLGFKQTPREQLYSQRVSNYRNTLKKVKLIKQDAANPSGELLQLLLPDEDAKFKSKMYRQMNRAALAVTEEIKHQLTMLVNNSSIDEISQKTQLPIDIIKTVLWLITQNVVPDKPIWQRLHLAFAQIIPRPPVDAVYASCLRLNFYETSSAERKNIPIHVRAQLALLCTIVNDQRTPEQIADAIGISKRELIYLVTNSAGAFVSSRLLVNMANAFNLSFEFLLTGAQPPSANPQHSRPIIPQWVLGNLDKLGALSPQYEPVVMSLINGLLESQKKPRAKRKHIQLCDMDA